jgi:hypothetical protein
MLWGYLIELLVRSRALMESKVEGLPLEITNRPGKKIETTGYLVTDLFRSYNPM